MQNSTQRQERQAEMFNLVAQWRGSGQTQRAFCTANNLSAAKLGYWIRRFKEYEQPADFVSMLPPLAGHAVLTISYANGTQLNFSSMPDLKFLRQLLVLN